MDLILDILGFLISIGFVWFTVRSSKSLVGSFFKKYYRLMTLAANVFGFGFLIETAGEIFRINGDLISTFHHILLIIAAIIFVYAGMVFPKEAEEVTKVK